MGSINWNVFGDIGVLWCSHILEMHQRWKIWPVKKTRVNPGHFFFCEVRESSESQKHGQAIPLTHIDTQKWRILSYFVVWISPLFSPLFAVSKLRNFGVRGRGGSPKSGCGSVSGWCCDCAGAAADHGTNVGTNVGTPGWKPHLRPQTVPLRHHSSRS